MEKQQWLDLLFQNAPAKEVWSSIAKKLSVIALAEDNPVQLHKEVVFPDRVLCEAAFPLWNSFLPEAPRTSNRLIQTCSQNQAVLILDALSIREIALLVNEAKKRGISATAEVTFSEAPSDTNTFAQALGVPSRANLKGNGKSANFKLFGGNCYTDVLNIPFADAPVPPNPNLVIWHSYLDDQIHLGRSCAELANLVRKEFSGDGFWSFVNKLRQGRKLVITSDHGYGVAEQFSSEICAKEASDILKHEFKAQRYAKIPLPQQKFMPPVFVANGEYCMVTGQRKWKAPGGFPKVCHGGLSLLEVASPWIELNALT